MRPLEAAARKAGVEFLLEHRMTAIYRDSPNAGRVLGVAVTNRGRNLNIRARKAVMIATGGSSGNVNFRRMFDPRLTEEYCGLAGMPWSNQDASGETAGMAIGASLWGAANQTLEIGDNITKPGKIGCQYGYVNLTWMPGSRVFDKARASGLRVSDWQNADSGQHARQTLLRRNRRRISRQSLQHCQSLFPAQLPQCAERQI